VIDDLRTALSAGDTPAGIDVGLVRARAHRLRRRRMALATAAAAAVTAVAVPVGLLRADPAPPAAPTPATLGCPDQVPELLDNTGPGLAEALVPVTPDGALVCSYGAGGTSTGGLTGVVRLTAAEVRSAVDRLDAAKPGSGPLICTSEFGYPFLLQVGGGGRVVTLRLEPYGCGRVTNGAREVMLGRDKELLRGLGDEARKSTACPDRLDVPPTVRTDGEAPGGTLLPTDTRRLLVCRYDVDGARTGAGKDWWNAVLDAGAATRVIEQLNAAPAYRPGVTGCPRDAGPLLALLAVTPDGVVSAVADGGGCGIVDNGERQVTAKRLVRKLAA
jgi:hypothetical protein